MMMNGILALTSFLSLVAAVPHNHKGMHAAVPHHKRAQVVHWDVETVMTTVTAWLPAGDARLTQDHAQYTGGFDGHQSAYNSAGSPVDSPAVQSTTLTTSATSSSSSAVSDTPTSVPASAATSSAQVLVSSVQAQDTTAQSAVYSAPVVPSISTTTSTSSSAGQTTTEAATTDTATTQALYVPTSSAYVAPLSPAAPAAQSDAGSGPMNGLCTAANPCYGDLTTYTAGSNACGKVDKDSEDDVVALSHLAWDAVHATTNYMTGITNCSFCDQTIAITLNGVTKTAKATDKCGGCNMFDLDMSTHLWKSFTGGAYPTRYIDFRNTTETAGIKASISWNFI